MADLAWGLTRGTRYLSAEHVYTDADNWDEIRCSYLTGATTLGGGTFFNYGASPTGAPGTFKLTHSTVRYGTGGDVIQDCVFQGMFATKWREETDSEIQSYSLTNFKLNVSGFPYPSGTTSATVWPRGNILVAMPVYTIVVVDNTAPALNLIGKAASSPYKGSFPTAPANPFTVPIGQATIQYPEGWYLRNLPSTEVTEGGGVWKKKYIYGYRWVFTP